MKNKRKPKHLRNITILVIALTLIGSAVLIWTGETTEWATEITKNGPSSLEIIP